MTARGLLRGVLIGLGVLVLLAAGTVWWALGTQSGSRRIVAYVLGKSTAGIRIGSVRGPLSGPLYLTGVHYRSGALSAELDSVLLDWRPTDLLRGRIQLDRVHVTGFRVILPDSAPPDTAGTARARREKPDTPLPVGLGEVLIRGFELDAPGGTSLRQGRMDLDGTLDAYRFSISGIAVLPRIDTTRAQLRGSGNLEGVSLDSTSSARVLAGTVRAQGALRWWPGIQWELEMSGDSIRPARLLENPAMLPGAIAFHGTTSGVLDSTGPAGRVEVDSLGGALRGQPLAGRISAQFSGAALDSGTLDVAWGSARLEAEASVRDSIAAEYVLAVADLGTVHPEARGVLEVQGVAAGTRRAPRIRAAIEGRRLGYGASGIGRLTGKADFHLARSGRTALELRGDSLRIGRRALDRLLLSLRGTREAHALTAAVTGVADTVRVGVSGGVAGPVWRGSITHVAVRTRPSDWNLQRPAGLVVSRAQARLDSLCVQGDSAAGRICARGSWSGAGRWEALALVEDLALERFPPPGSSGALKGRLSARAEAAGRDALVATAEVRVRSEEGEALALVEGRATLRGFGRGRPRARLPVDARVTGRIGDIGWLEPLVPAADSLEGKVELELAVGGTLGAPEVDGTLRGDDLIVGLPGSRLVRGAARVTADVDLRPDRSVEGEVRLVQSGVRLEFRLADSTGRLAVDSGAVVLAAGAEGLRATAALTVRDEAGDSAAGAALEVRLPRWRGPGRPLGPEPLELEATAAIPDLGVFQPLAMQIDSLHGSLGLQLSASGTVGMPDLTGKLVVVDAAGRLPSGILVRGGLTGDLALRVARDSTVSGRLRLEPQSVFVESFRSGPGPIAVRESALEITAGADGVRGALDLTLAAEGDARLALVRGRGGLPRFRRIGRPLQTEPVEGTLEATVDDLAFLPALTRQVDSAAGRVELEARLTGTLGRADLAGELQLRDGAARLPVLGILLEDVSLTARGSEAGTISVDGRLRSGGGQLTLTGSTPVRPLGTDPGRFRIRGENVEIADNSQVRAVLSPRLDVSLAGDTMTVRGAVDVPLARIQLTEVPEFAISPSDDVILRDRPEEERAERPLVTEIRVELGDSVSFRGFNFDAELGGSVLIMQEPGQLTRASGSLIIEEGHYKAYGQDLTIENGTVRFAGGPVDNPGLSIRATRVADDSVVAGIAMSGSLKEPEISLFSEPLMSQSQVLSYITTGRAIGQGSGSGGNLIDKALSALGVKGGNLIAKAVGQEVGLDEAKIETEGDLQEASLVVGRYLSPSLYITYGIGLFDPVSTLRLRYVLSNRFTLEAETGGQGTSADALVKVRRRR